MKVFELVVNLQQMPADAEVYIGWTELNESGTEWDTGTKASHLEKEWDGENKPERVVIR